MFELRVLGGASIEGPGGALGGRVSQRRRLALLCVLARARIQPLSRDRLLGLFWPESDSERARHNLADSVYQIRKELGERSILTVGDDLALNPEVVTSDAGDFEDALTRGELARAVSLYRGPFLEGFFLSEAPGFDRWAEIERDRLARAYAGALEQLAEQAEARGDVKGSVEWWRRLAAEDHFNARVTLRLMEALAAAGDPAGAFQQARVHAALLEQEFGAEPDPQVAALAERLRTGTAIRASKPREPGTSRLGAAASHTLPAKEKPPDSRDLTELPEPPRPVAAHRIGVAWRSGRALGFLGVAIAAVFAVIWLWPQTSVRPGVAAESATAAPISIAVLPCANLDSDPEKEYFSDGLTEELIGVLSQVRALQVVARTSTFAFKGENQDIREIGEALNVGTLLECSVRRSGDRVRVSAQLINAANGFHLWSDTYEREGTDIFAIQSELALRIVEGLRAELTPAERARLGHRPTTNQEAHALYLKGRYFLNQRTSNAYVRAVEHFERAVEADPRYARAHAGLANVYAMQGLRGDLSPAESRERTRQAVLEALALDDQLAEAHAVLGGYYHILAWDTEAAERAFRHALELDPNYATGRHYYANLLTSMDRFEDAIAERRAAVELDPLSPHLSYALGRELLRVGRPYEALEHFRNAIALDSLYTPGHLGLALNYESIGNLDDAIRVSQWAVQLASASWVRAELAGVLARAGRPEEAHTLARTLLGELRAEAARTGNYPTAGALALLALEDVDGALAWLERSYQQKHPSLRLMGRPPGLAGDPRFLDLRGRIGLPQ